MAKNLTQEDAFRIETPEAKTKKSTRLASRRNHQDDGAKPVAKYQLNCLLSEDLKKPIKRMCVEEETTLGDIIEPLLRKSLAAKGYLSD